MSNVLPRPLVAPEAGFRLAIFHAGTLVFPVIGGTHSGVPKHKFAGKAS